MLRMIREHMLTGLIPHTTLNPSEAYTVLKYLDDESGRQYRLLMPRRPMCITDEENG